MSCSNQCHGVVNSTLLYQRLWKFYGMQSILYSTLIGWVTSVLNWDVIWFNALFHSVVTIFVSYQWSPCNFYMLFIHATVAWRKFFLFLKILMFFLYKAQGPVKVECYQRWLLYEHILCRYAKKIMVNLRLEEVKNVVVGKSSSWDSVLQSKSSWEEAIRVEFAPY